MKKFITDARSFQISSDLEANFKSQTRNDAAVRPQAPENADQVSRASMEENKYENDQRHLCQSPSSVER